MQAHGLKPPKGYESLSVHALKGVATISPHKAPSNKLDAVHSFIYTKGKKTLNAS